MPNDVLMFKPSGFSIAMGNASKDVQAEADAVTDSYDDEGFAKAVEKFILTRKRRMTPVIDVQPDGASCRTPRRGVGSGARPRHTGADSAVACPAAPRQRRLYGLLAPSRSASRFPWDRTHVFFGDERFVPHDHPDSNYRMAREAMLANVPMPEAQVHPWQTDGDPERTALHYADTLKRFYGTDTLDPGQPAVRRDVARSGRRRAHGLAVSRRRRAARARPPGRRP